jgi:cellulose synthase/poly-beta-1,6-N-acetylglucosamine synthase-like glycosyltransferase
MIVQTVLHILIVSQLLYLLNLIATNLSSTVFIFYALRNMILTYFTEKSNLIQNYILSETHLPISILVPAYNEETTIIQSVTALLNIKFNEYEVIVINDGSGDATMEKLKNAFDLYPIEIPRRLSVSHRQINQIYHSYTFPHLVVVDKENGGKSDALNAGINLSKYPLFCSLDADTILNSDSILKAVLLFSQDGTTIATGGTIGILNGSTLDEQHRVHRSLPRKLIEKMQIIEYTRGFLAGRTFWATVNGLLIVSGAFGIFRKDIVIAINGYRHTIGEDLDLLIRMRRYCYLEKKPHRVSYLPDIMCWTQAPADYSSLLKQRNRWHRGLIETLYYNRSMLFNPRYGVIGMVTLPYYFLIEALNPLVTFLGVISIIILYLFGLINRDTILLFFMLEFAWGISLNILSFWLEIFIKHTFRTGETLRLILNGLVEPFYYKPLIKMEQLIASFTFMNTHWGDIRRHTMSQKDNSGTKENA